MLIHPPVRTLLIYLAIFSDSECYPQCGKKEVNTSAIQSGKETLP